MTTMTKQQGGTASLSRRIQAASWALRQAHHAMDAATTEGEYTEAQREAKVLQAMMVELRGALFAVMAA